MEESKSYTTILSVNDHLVLTGISILSISKLDNMNVIHLEPCLFKQLDSVYLSRFK